MKNKKFLRISKVSATFMVTVAILYDLLEIGVDWIPALGQVIALIIDIFALMHFTLWFKLKGIKLGSPKKIARYWLPMLLELIPFPLIDFFLTTLGGNFNNRYNLDRRCNRSKCFK